MEIFLVGGAVRDELLGLDVKDHDWVVVGGNPEYFEKNGYQQVGKDFPVFLHPETKDEYALARKERKVGVGYHGFEVDFDSSVTLEDDLMRRDLTINAIAKDKDGNYVDPYGGVKDLKDKVLRHVSESFKEDPVRVLRIARFMARYGNQGFKIADETMDLMKEMVINGELNHLVRERTTQEMFKSFNDPKPSLFFEVLRDCGALEVVFPEIDVLYGIPQPEQYHPEGCVFTHTMMVLDRAKEISGDHAVMYAALTHDLGKALTPSDEWPHHYRHEFLGIEACEKFADKNKIPADFKKLSMMTSEYHTKLHGIKSLTAKKVHEVIEAFDYTRNKELLRKFALVCQSDAQGRTGGYALEPYTQSKFIVDAAEHAFGKIDVRPLIEKGLKGKEIGEQVRKMRMALVGEFINGQPERVAKAYESFKKDFAKYAEMSKEERCLVILKTRVKNGIPLMDKIKQEHPEIADLLSSDIDAFYSIDGKVLVDEGFKADQVGVELMKRRTSRMK